MFFVDDDEIKMANAEAPPAVALVPPVAVALVPPVAVAPPLVDTPAVAPLAVVPLDVAAVGGVTVLEIRDGVLSGILKTQ